MASTEPALHLALVEPEIHWNTGNTGRTCLATGAQLHLVEPLGFSLEAKEVRRAGLDYWPRVDPRVWPDLEAFEAALPELGEPFLVSPEAERLYWEVEYPPRVVLMLGRESVGFSSEVRRRYADRMVRIPMQDPLLRSVNVSTCAALVMFEVLRQRARGS